MTVIWTMVMAATRHAKLSQTTHALAQHLHHPCASSLALTQPWMLVKHAMMGTQSMVMDVTQLAKLRQDGRAQLQGHLVIQHAVMVSTMALRCVMTATTLIPGAV